MDRVKTITKDQNRVINALSFANRQAEICRSNLNIKSCKPINGISDGCPKRDNCHIFIRVKELRIEKKELGLENE